MKTNLKSGNAIVRLLLTHGEKIGILAIAVCTGLVIWSAIGQERLGSKPSELDSLAKKAKLQVTSFTWDDLSQEDKKIAEPVPESMMAKISPKDFPIYAKSFDPPVSDPVTQRSDPTLLAVLDLEVNADSGLWASASPQVIRRKSLEMERERALEERERAAARDRAEREGARGRRGRGGRGGDPYGGGDGYGGDPGRRGLGRDGKPMKDAPIIERPRQGAQLHGFEDITAKSWVTLLAKVPIEQQTQAYIDSLRTSRGYDETVDIPRYLGYQIDRAEVTSKGLGEWKKVAFIFDKKLIKEIATYPVNVPDVIDPDVKHPLLTHPLPPLILKEWGERVSHSSMPLAVEKAEAEAKALEQTEEVDEPDESMSEEESFADSQAKREERRRASGGGYGRGGYGGEMGGYGGEMGGYGGEMGGYGGEMGGYGGEMGGYGGEMGGYGGEMGGYGGRGGYGGSMGMGSDVTLEEFVWDHETPHVLFRYFDKTVEAGHSYRYRVRLNLRDVNHDAKPQHLDKAVTLRREKVKKGLRFFRWSDWSEPSPVASVPLPARVYLVSAKPVRESSFTTEPSTEILIKALNSEYAAEVSRLESFNRGSVIDISDKATVIWASKFEEMESPSFNFLTGITVLDFTGGEKLGKSKDLLAPSRALLMDAAGHLFVQEEMEDLETVAEYQAIVEAGKDDRSRGGGGYGGEMGGEMGGYGEEGGGYGGEGF